MVFTASVEYQPDRRPRDRRMGAQRDQHRQHRHPVERVLRSLYRKRCHRPADQFRVPRHLDASPEHHREHSKWNPRPKHSAIFRAAYRPAGQRLYIADLRRALRQSGPELHVRSRRLEHTPRSAVPAGTSRPSAAGRGGTWATTLVCRVEKGLHEVAFQPRSGGTDATQESPAAFGVW